jgi:hypothetical protein
MLGEFVNHIALETGLSPKTARAALGVVLNAADRQGAAYASEIFERVAGARTLAARAGAEQGVATGVIARLIEQTPGGRKAVAEQMLASLHKEGLGHNEIGALFPAISSFVSSEFGIRGIGHLGDFLGGPADTSLRSVQGVA